MATPQQQFQGLLEQYGLPSMSRDEYFQARDKAFVNSPNDAGKQAGVDTRAGRGMGLALGRLFRKGKGQGMPDELNDRFEIVEQAQNRFTKLRTDNSELWNSMTAEDKALTYRRFLADAAAEVGQGDLATALNDEYVSAYNARMKQKMELEKLGIESASALEDLQQITWENNNKRTFGVPTVGYPAGSSDPNTGIAGTHTPDNSFRFIDPDTGREVVVPSGGWTPTRPSRPPQPRASSSGSGGGGSWEGTPTEIRNMRQAVVSTTNQLRVTMDMHKLMKDIAQEYGSIEFMSTAGGVTAFTTRLVENVAAMTRTAEQFAIPYVDSDDNKVGMLNPDNQASWKAFTKSSVGKNWMQDFETDLQNNQHLRDTFLTAEQWAANVVRLAYARARAREPGARQLSDNDIQQARAELGAMTTDPEAFRQIMLTGMGSDIEQLEQHMELMLGGVDQKERDRLFGRKGMEEYYQLRDGFYEAYRDSGPWGTANAPGPGLMPPAAPGAPPAPGQQRQIIAYDENGEPIYAPAR